MGALDRVRQGSVLWLEAMIGLIFECHEHSEAILAA
jgi:hypothetical protein